MLVLSGNDATALRHGFWVRPAGGRLLSHVAPATRGDLALWGRERELRSSFEPPEQ